MYSYAVIDIIDETIYIHAIRMHVAAHAVAHFIRSYIVMYTYRINHSASVILAVHG